MYILEISQLLKMGFFMQSLKIEYFDDCRLHYLEFTVPTIQRKTERWENPQNLLTTLLPRDFLRPVKVVSPSKLVAGTFRATTGYSPLSTSPSSST